METGKDCESDSAMLTPFEALKSVRQFAKENHLKYKRNITFCKLCKIKISSSLKRLKEHVAEPTHEEKAEQFTKVVIPKVPLSEYVSSAVSIEDSDLCDMLIAFNDKFCISYTNFETLYPQEFKLKCHMCDTFISYNKVGSHINSQEHRINKKETLVLTQFETEFMRELRPGVYHCGFCNTTEDSIDELKVHMKSMGHAALKTKSANQLNSHMPDIIKLQNKETAKGLIKTYSYE